MAQVVLDARGEATLLTTGELQQPADVVADNAILVKPNGKEKPTETKEVKVDPKPDPNDDVEGEDGFTPKQKREFTESMLKSIGKKHAQMKDAQEFATEQYNTRILAEKRAQELERELNRLKVQPTQTEKPAENEKPKRENFETDDAFRDALVDWQVDQKLKAKEAEAAQQREAERQALIVEQARSRIAKALDLVPDYAEVTGRVDLEVPPVIAGYMQESEMFAELGYHLAKHPDVLEKLQKMPPAKALVEIGKIESKLEPFGTASSTPKASNGDTPSPKTGSDPSTDTGTAIGSTPSQPRAPVITPLTTTSTSQARTDEREMTAQEALAAWQKQRRVDLNRRRRH
jgi:hypothetical protein